MNYDSEVEKIAVERNVSKQEARVLLGEELSDYHGDDAL